MISCVWHKASWRWFSGFNQHTVTQALKSRVRSEVTKQLSLDASGDISISNTLGVAIRDTHSKKKMVNLKWRPPVLIKIWVVLRFVVSCLYIKRMVNYEWYSPLTAYSGWRSAQHAADLLCHDGCPGHTILSTDTHPAGFWTSQSSPPRMMSISSQHAAGASYKPELCAQIGCQIGGRRGWGRWVWGFLGSSHSDICCHHSVTLPLCLALSIFSLASLCLRDGSL